MSEKKRPPPLVRRSSSSDVMTKTSEAGVNHWHRKSSNPSAIVEKDEWSSESDLRALAFLSRRHSIAQTNNLAQKMAKATLSEIVHPQHKSNNKGKAAYRKNSSGAMIIKVGDRRPSVGEVVQEVLTKDLDYCRYLRKPGTRVDEMGLDVEEIFGRKRKDEDQLYEDEESKEED